MSSSSPPIDKMTLNSRKLDEFPVELLEEIFSHMDYLSLTFNVRLTCKRFDAILQNAHVGDLGKTLFRIKKINDTPQLLEHEKVPNFQGFCYYLHPCLRTLQIRYDPSKLKEPVGLNDVGFLNPDSGVFTPITSTKFASEYAISRPVYKTSFMKVHGESNKNLFIHTPRLLKESMKVPELVASFIQQTRDEYASQHRFDHSSVENGYCSLLGLMTRHTGGHKWNTRGLLYPFFDAQHDMFLDDDSTAAAAANTPNANEWSRQRVVRKNDWDKRIWVICGTEKYVEPDPSLKRKPKIGWIRWLSLLLNGEFWQLL